MLSSLLVFDIETVPDTDSCDNLVGRVVDGGVTAKREAMADYHLEVTSGQNQFLRQPFHKIVTISFLRADIRRDLGCEHFTLREIRSGGTVSSTERELVRGLLGYISTIKPRIVTFNGRTFDLPVIKYRAMVHGIQAGYLYNSGDKWNNYFQRYSTDWHCDLLDYLSDFGTSARVKMHEVCSVLNFPGKIGIDGSEVMRMYDCGQLSEIRDYCESDVINTYLVYLRLMHHQGRMTSDGYNECIKDLLAYLQSSGNRHMLEFVAEWEKVCGGQFFMMGEGVS
ncbi:MAG: 3'-5' exonuclease [Anaplasma ovis]|uniref:3'-5' exonuclease n=1 Tax=Anaplasma ovis str. Haibei TaxID=1248439 RepID=A0A2Z2L8B9_9RICK|nr:3'-5' exonuclease [Anaplasma ovis]ASI47787.1 3'-5' exonuclease [Anaplasma ovis str. Haibei]